MKKKYILLFNSFRWQLCYEAFLPSLQFNEIYLKIQWQESLRLKGTFWPTARSQTSVWQSSQDWFIEGSRGWENFAVRSVTIEERYFLWTWQFQVFYASSQNNLNLINIFIIPHLLYNKSSKLYTLAQKSVRESISFINY